MKQKISVILLLTLLLSAVGGCGNTFDVSSYVKACLDVQFLGVYEDYIRLTKVSEDEAAQLYHDGLDLLLSGYSEWSLSEARKADFRNAYAELLKSVPYDVKSASQKNDVWTVRVGVKPMHCFDSYEEALVKLQQNLTDEWQAKANNDGEVPSEEELTDQMADRIYKDFITRIQNPSFGKEKIVKVRVTKGKDHVYRIHEEDLKKVSQTAFSLL